MLPKFPAKHLMRDFTVDETILAVKAFEKVMAQANCSVKHYHADNGAFAHKGFQDEVNRKEQKITFCAFGAHHQNGIIENKNKILTLSARTLLLHGIRMWPQMIDTTHHRQESTVDTQGFDLNTAS